MRVPRGFTALARGARRALVRDDLVPVLGPWLLAGPLAAPPGATPVDGGRGGTFRLAAGPSRAIVRLGRRGGVVAALVRERYAGLAPRPWRELAVTLGARERGAPVPEVLAACVHGWLVYRSAVVTAEVADARTAIEALAAAPSPSARGAIAAVAAGAIARLHASGVEHADLNLTNVLIAEGGAMIVDLDRARLRSARLGDAARRRNLRRLRRSAAKLDPSGALVDAAVMRVFHAAYADATGVAGARPSACGS